MHKKAFKNPQFAMVDPVQRFQKMSYLRILIYYIRSITLAVKISERAPRQCSGERLRELCAKCCAYGQEKKHNKTENFYRNQSPKKLVDQSKT